MGYYENPPIINLNSGAEKIAQGIMSGANSLAEAFIKRGERRREEEKEQKLTIQKLQDQKNKTDLYYNEKLSDWSSKNTDTGSELDKKIRSMLQQKIQYAADAQIALTMETDPTKRASYLKTIKDADTFMTTAANFGKSVAMDTATWRENAPGTAVGVANGWVVNGKDKQEIFARTGAVEILGGMTNAYDSHNIDIIDEGGTFSLKLSGKRKDTQEEFKDLVINANSYLGSDKEGGGGFLQKVENVDEFHKTAKKAVLDDKGDILPSFLNATTETAYVKSAGDKYKLEFAKKLNVDNVKAEIQKQSNIKASGYLRADKEASLRALLDYTLEKQPGYYDDTFKKLEPAQKQQVLSQILTDDVFTKMTRDMEQTTDKDGNTVYWGGKELRKTLEEPKETKLSGGSKKATEETAATGSGRVFSEDQINEYMQMYKSLYNNPDGQFVVEIQGPKGGVREETFYVDPKTRKIVSDKNNVGFSPTSFKSYLRNKRIKPALKG
jgi:hypothetical protein